VISGFRCTVDELCALLGYYAAYGGNSLLMLWDNLLVPSSKVKKSSWITTIWCVISQKSEDLISLMLLY